MELSFNQKQNIIGKITDEIMKQAFANWKGKMFIDFGEGIIVVNSQLKLEYMTALKCGAKDCLNDEQHEILMQTINIIEIEAGLRPAKELAAEHFIRTKAKLITQIETDYLNSLNAHTCNHNMPKFNK